MADLASLSREELIELIATQQRMIEDQPRRIARGGRRQAAPFSKGKRVENPQSPGRKPG
jgi:transposase